MSILSDSTILCLLKSYPILPANSILSDPTCQLYPILSYLSSIEIVKEQEGVELSSYCILEIVLE